MYIERYFVGLNPNTFIIGLGNMEFDAVTGSYLIVSLNKVVAIDIHKAGFDGPLYPVSTDLENAVSEEFIQTYGTLLWIGNEQVFLEKSFFYHI